MGYTRNAIYSYIRAKVLAEYSSANVTAIYSDSPSKFPAVMIRQIGKIRTPRFIELNFTDNQSMVTWEIVVVSHASNSAMSQAYGIMGVIEEAFNDLKFIEDTCQPIEESASNYRIAARFHRYIGGGDEMPS